MVVILSPAAKGSQWVNIEVNFALRLGRRVFPVVIAGDDTEAVPITLFTTQHVDARNDFAGPVATKLLPALRNYLGMDKSGTDSTQQTWNLPDSRFVQVESSPLPVVTSSTLLAQLRGVLAELYDDESSAHRIVADAGIKAARINFSGRMADTWHAILQEAEKASKLGDLLVVAVREYGDNQPLQAALVALGMGELLAGGKQARQQSSNPPDSRVMQHEINPQVTAQKVMLAVDQTSPQPARAVTPQDSVASPIDLDWVTIPAGKFWMGSDKQKDQDASKDELPQHEVDLPAYRITRTPITNIQYKVFVDAKNHAPPKHWNNGRIPRGRTQHPVVNVNWQDAQAFCHWITIEIGQAIRLPTEAEWEKAARGIDGRIWPWGNTPPTNNHCNFSGKIGDTTPVASYLDGISPYGCLDMAGNVWEWTCSLYMPYPYMANDGREDITSNDFRVVRGGSFSLNTLYTRCAFRYKDFPSSRAGSGGFRIVLLGG